MASYLMGNPKHPKEIQSVAKVSESTIRHAYKLLYVDRNKLITDELVARGADPGKLPKPS